MSNEATGPHDASADWLDLIFRRSTQAVVIGTLPGTITSANAAAERLFGYGPGEMAGLVASDTIDDPSRLAEAQTQGERSGSFAGELWLVRKDGTRFEGSVFSVRFGERIWMMIQDNSALRESEQRFRALSDATFEAVIVHDAGKILFANAAAHEMARCEDLSGRDLFDFVAPESRQYVRERILAGDTLPYEAMVRRADGTTVAAESRGRNIESHGRSLRIATLRDLSEQKRLEADLAARDRLATMGRLAAGVAHEINNPLTFALLNLEAVTRRIRDGAVGTAGDSTRLLEMLEQAHLGLDRVSRVVQDMRTFSRVEPRDASAVQLERVLDYAARVAGPELRRRASLRLDVPERLYVLGDEARLGQVFVNLLVNAAHAIPEGSPETNDVTVEASHDGGEVEIRVRDTGSGLSEDVRARLFEPFHTTKPVGVGLGLGLSICQAILRSLHGTISAEAAPERGTIFRVRLPWVSEPGESAESP